MFRLFIPVYQSIKEEHEFSIFICDFPRFCRLQFISEAGTNEKSCLVNENVNEKHSNSHTVICGKRLITLHSAMAALQLREWR